METKVVGGMKLFSVKGTVTPEGDIAISQDFCGAIVSQNVLENTVTTSKYSGIPASKIVTEFDRLDTMPNLFCKKPLPFNPDFHLYCESHHIDKAVQYVLHALETTVLSDILELGKLIGLRGAALKSIKELQAGKEVE